MMVFNKKIKYCILFFNILFFVILSRIVFNGDKTILSNQKYRDNLVLNISIDNQMCSYDKESGVFFYSAESTNYKKWNIKLNSLYKLNYDIAKIDDNNFLITAFNNDYYEDIKLTITSLPIVDLQNLDIKSMFLSHTYPKVDKNIIFKFLDDNIEFETVEYYARFDDNTKKISRYDKIDLKIRGASSILYPKKSYKISFKNNIELLDLPKDDKYVLDALYVDSSKIRNLLSSYLWDLINNNQSVQNDLSGDFVELFIDNQYTGLYVLKEKIDKSVTKISDDGVILKSIFHMNDFYIDKLLSYNYSISDNSFLNFDIKYYNKISFHSIIDKMKKYYANYDFDSINDNFDLSNYLNYYIYVILLSGDDNIDYNYYLSLFDRDSKILITPWDMDLTWGLNWNDETLFGLFSMQSSNDIEWINSAINKMDNKTLQLLKKRYWELRKNAITMNTINNYLDSYKSLLVNSGAAKRDSERWYEYDIEYEIENIREWTKRRIEFLDQYFS